METLLVVLCSLGVLVGIVGVVVPVLPGVPVCWVAVLVWALLADAGAGRWLVLGLCTGWAVVGVVVQYAWPGRRMRSAGVPSRTLLAGAGLGVVGFFVVPVVGLPLGFVLGVWLAEAARLGGFGTAWPSAVQALKGAGLSMLVELGSAVAVAVTFAVGVVLTW